MYLSMEDLRKTWKYKFYHFIWIKAGKLTRLAGKKIVKIVSDNEKRYEG